MSCATYSCVAKAGDVGLTGNRMKETDPLHVLISFADAPHPQFDLLPRLKELGYDVIGPAPLGEVSNDQIRGERPHLVAVVIEDAASEALSWVVRIWQEFRTPVVVVTMNEDPAVLLSAIHAGAFAAIHHDAPIDQIHSAFALAALRGSALREAQDRIEQLERNLANRRVVEQAKWKLVQQDGMTEPDAHLALQTVARNTRKPLLDVAQAVVDGVSLSSITER